MFDQERELHPCGLLQFTRRLLNWQYLQTGSVHNFVFVLLLTLQFLYLCWNSLCVALLSLNSVTNSFRAVFIDLRSKKIWTNWEKRGTMKISTNRPTVSCYSTAVLFLNLRVAKLTNDVICWSPSLSPWLSSFASWPWWQSLSRCWWSPLHTPRPGSPRTADRSPCCIPPPAASFIKVLFWLFWWSTCIIMIDTINIWTCSWE